jgi:vacuolar-type H+-ATPase subunit H
MEEDILSKVVHVETELQKNIKEEKEKAHELVERAKKDAEREVLEAESRIKEALDRSVKDARLLSEEKIAGTLKGAKADSERVERISDDLLRKFIMKHIRGILPEE